MAKDFTNPWGQGGKHWPPKWMEKDSVSEEQQTATENVFLNPPSKSSLGGNGFANESEPGTGKVLKLGFMQADIAVENVKAKALRIVQVIYFTPNPALSKQYGKPLTVGSKTYNGFVDGGKNSPDVLIGGEVGDPSKPYFYGPSMRAAKKQYESWNGKSGNIVVTDAPFAAFNYDDFFVETYIVASNYNNQTSDKVLAKFTWGFKKFGTIPNHTSKINLIKTNSLSTAASTIIKNDGYKYTTVK